MFSSFMLNAWEVGSVVALVAGLVGYFVVLRRAAFAAHAIPNGAFAGAAGASLIGQSTLLGLGVFSVLGGVAITLMGRRGRNDVATALVLVAMLGLGSAFLSQGTGYEGKLYGLLFGEILGVSSSSVVPVFILGACTCAIILALFRPLLLASTAPDLARAQGIRVQWLDMAFGVMLALTTTLTVPVVGALLMFPLMIGPPAAARICTKRPGAALALSAAFALVVLWVSLALAYQLNWPVGFFVGCGSALLYATVRVGTRLRAMSH